MKTMGLIAGAVLLSSQACAESELEGKEKALSVLKKYTETVACNTNFEESDGLESHLKDIYTIEKDEEMGSATYYILWYGDIGCNGGSGTTAYYVSEVGRYTGSRPLLVNNNNAFGEEFQEINSRFIESMERLSDNKFAITSYGYKEDDPNSFPSLEYKYVLEKQGWNWKVINKELIRDRSGDYQ